MSPSVEENVGSRSSLRDSRMLPLRSRESVSMVMSGRGGKATDGPSSSSSVGVSSLTGIVVRGENLVAGEVAVDGGSGT